MNLVEALQNQIFTGMVGGAAVVGLLHYLKEIPGSIWELVKWRFTSTLTVFNEDAAFERVSEWLAGLEGADKTRHLRLTSIWDNSTDSDVERPSPGVGTHLFWYKKRPILVRRTLPDKSAVGGAKRLEDIKIITFSSGVLRDLVSDIHEARARTRGNSVEVYMHRHHWRLACRKPKRDLSTVVIPEEQKQRILSDIARFLESRDWYTRRGIPYRRGYLLEGPPGGGKTSLALAIAGMLCRPVYALNLGSLDGDDALIDAIASVPEHAVLLIEDIDAVDATARRINATKPAGPVTDKAEPSPITLSAMLNALDGAFAREGRILIMTTNRPEKIDSALLRPGRTDRREHIGQMGFDEAVRMAELFTGSDYEAKCIAAGLVLPIAAAELQEILVSRQA